MSGSTISTASNRRCGCQALPPSYESLPLLSPPTFCCWAVPRVGGGSGMGGGIFSALSQLPNTVVSGRDADAAAAAAALAAAVVLLPALHFRGNTCGGRLGGWRHWHKVEICVAAAAVPLTCALPLHSHRPSLPPPHRSRPQLALRSLHTAEDISIHIKV